jgi:hypothetical protein
MGSRRPFSGICLDVPFPHLPLPRMQKPHVLAGHCAFESVLSAPAQLQQTATGCNDIRLALSKGSLAGLAQHAASASVQPAWVTLTA